MCGYFIFPDYSNHYRFFGRVVFVLGIFVLAGEIKDACRHPVFQATVAYMLYLILSGLWGESMDWYRLGQKITISIYLLSFILITSYLIRRDRILYDRMLQFCVVVAAVAALVSLVVFYQTHAFPGDRAVGLGSLTNVNEFANVFGVFALLAMSFALRAGKLQYRVLFLLAVWMFVCFAWFGQSRMAFVSMVIALLGLVIALSREKKALNIAILVVITGVLVAIFPELVEKALLRGEGFRPLIWIEVWDEIKSAPVVGHGLTQKLSVEAAGQTFGTAHNAFLQVLWQGGVIGLGLFLLLLLALVRAAWLQARQHGDFTILFMLVFAASTMMTGVDTLIERPRDQWMLFWFPLALLIGYQNSALQVSRTGPEKA